MDDRVLAAALVLAAAVVLFFRLGQGPLLDFDEATYAEIAREIGAYHDFVHLHFNFTPWFNKAPLYQWLTAGLFQVFGPSELWARAVSAAAGAGVVGLTYLVGRTWLERLPAAGAALIVLLSNLFVRAARFGTSDILLTFWIYLGIYGYLRTRGSPRWWYLVGASWGLAFMTKDIASLVGPAAVVVALVIDGRLAALRRPEPYAAVALAVAIALPWHIAMYLWQGSAFLQQYISYMVVARAQAQIEGHTGGLGYYAIWSGIGFYPWVFAAVAGFIPHVLVDIRERRASSVLAVLTVGVLALYTVVRSKLYWYIDPLMPAYALFAAAGIAWLLRRRAVELAAIAALVAAVGIWISPNTVSGLPVWLQWTFTAVLVAAVIASLARGGRPLPVVAAGALAFTVASAITVAPLYDLPEQPGRALGVPARTEGSGPLLLYVSNEAVQFPNDNVAHSLGFYSHRQVITLFGADALRASVSCGRTADVVLDQVDLAAVESDYAVTPHKAWFRLQLDTLRSRC